MACTCGTECGVTKAEPDTVPGQNASDTVVNKNNEVSNSVVLMMNGLWLAMAVF
jgi:hypothetical protein